MDISSSLPDRSHFSDAFRERIENELRPLLDEARNFTSAGGHQIDIQLRDNCIHLYYRGGKILEINPRSYAFDRFYFYRPTGEERNYPKSYVEKITKGKGLDTRSPRHPVPGEEEAKRIFDGLTQKQGELLGLLHKKEYHAYFDRASREMDAWLACYPKPEREDQHRIALANRAFTEENDLIVIDIEYAVSKKVPYRKSGFNKQCRFDLVAVDRTGQLYVVELKQNLKADRKGSGADTGTHLSDFNDTLQRDDDLLFTAEMARVVEWKKRMGLLAADVTVNRWEKLRFCAAFSGDEAEKAAFRAQCASMNAPLLHVNKDYKIARPERVAEKCR